MKALKLVTGFVVVVAASIKIVGGSESSRVIKLEDCVGCFPKVCVSIVTLILLHDEAIDHAHCCEQVQIVLESS